MSQARSCYGVEVLQDRREAVNAMVPSSRTLIPQDAVTATGPVSTLIPQDAMTATGPVSTLIPQDAVTATGPVSTLIPQDAVPATGPVGTLIPQDRREAVNAMVPSRTLILQDMTTCPRSSDIYGTSASGDKTSKTLKFASVIATYWEDK